MTRRITPEGPLRDFPLEVGTLWRSRNNEPEQEVFDRLPEWMRPQNEDRDTLIDLERLVPAILEGLGPKEQKVLWYRFWGDYTLEETSKFLDVTRERIRQIEVKALRKLKHPSRNELLQPFADICPAKYREKIESYEASMKLLEENKKKEEDARIERHIRRFHKRKLEDEFEIWLRRKLEAELEIWLKIIL